MTKEDELKRELKIYRAGMEDRLRNRSMPKLGEKALAGLAGRGE